jgi:hypothetical protein
MLQSIAFLKFNFVRLDLEEVALTRRAGSNPDDRILAL